MAMAGENMLPVIEDPLLKRFLRGMRGLAGGVCVIATEYGGERYGLTVTSVCSLSVAPPSLVLCVNRDADAYEPIVKARVLSVNVLSAAQRQIARVFGGLESTKGRLRFERTAWLCSAAGLPVLEGCLASLDCDVAHICEYTTHSVLICTVRSVSVDEGAPLVYWKRDFHTLKSAGPWAGGVG
jgi:flavin reductase (DIM6/NTAB) family NADH-FMN oxidoreductase RutF